VEITPQSFSGMASASIDFTSVSALGGRGLIVTAANTRLEVGGDGGGVGVGGGGAVGARDMEEAHFLSRCFYPR